MNHDLFKPKKTGKKGEYTILDGAYFLVKGKPDWAANDGRFPSTSWNIFSRTGDVIGLDKNGKAFSSQHMCISYLRTQYLRGNLPESTPKYEQTYYLRGRPSWTGGGRPQSRASIEMVGGMYQTMWARPTFEMARDENDLIALDQDDCVYATVTYDLPVEGHERIKEILQSDDCNIEFLPAIPTSVAVPTTDTMLTEIFTKELAQKSGGFFYISFDQHIHNGGGTRWTLEAWAEGNKQDGCTLFATVTTREGRVLAQCEAKVKGGDGSSKHLNDEYRPVSKKLYEDVLTAALETVSQDTSSGNR